MSRRLLFFSLHGERGYKRESWRRHLETQRRQTRREGSSALQQLPNSAELQGPCSRSITDASASDAAEIFISELPHRIRQRPRAFEPRTRIIRAELAPAGLSSLKTSEIA
ncbi:hypothetical protein WMY93_024205 [Mugilogobius chulae]|uniref:Uncharacterized protein n=1 Tax=Mugilogobius chulae TaxID=88201 RepID=A0AAW0N3V8_9GOBI